MQDPTRPSDDRLRETVPPAPAIPGLCRAQGGSDSAPALTLVAGYRNRNCPGPPPRISGCDPAIPGVRRRSSSTSHSRRPGDTPGTKHLMFPPPVRVQHGQAPPSAPHQCHPRAESQPRPNQPPLPATPTGGTWAVALRQSTLDLPHELRFTGIARAIDEQIAMPDIAELVFEDRLSLLLERQQTDPERCRYQRLKRHARLRLDADPHDVLAKRTQCVTIGDVQTGFDWNLEKNRQLAKQRGVSF